MLSTLKEYDFLHILKTNFHPLGGNNASIETV